MSLVESISLPVAGRTGPEPRRVAPARTDRPRWVRPSLNLAPLRYARVVGPEQPVRQVSVVEQHGEEGRRFLAAAFLAPELAPAMRTQVFGRGHGGGYDASPLVAKSMAISEALERWAYFATREAAPRAGGFDVDPTTNGMAAYPGLLAAQARRRALREAVERFALLSWWEGAGAARPLTLADPAESAWQLGESWEGYCAVLVCRDDREAGLRFYGHAAGRSEREAVERARSEMRRHEQVVRHYVDTCPDPQLGLTQLTQASERRALYFALPEGQAHFRDRLRAGSWKSRPAPRVAFDGAIVGPWSEYADVWRVAYEPPSTEFLSQRSDVFFW